jgi:outer membrane protein TolC
MRAITLSLGLALVLPLGVQGQILTNITGRSLSLEQCIAMALEKNIDLQLAKIEVRGGRTDLLTTAGYYDPVFETVAAYEHSVEAGRRDPLTGFRTIPGDRSTHEVSSGVTGRLPWGMRYDIGGDLRYFTTEERFDLGFGMTNVTRPGEYHLDTGIVLTQPLLRDAWTDEGRTLIKLVRQDLKMAEFFLRTQTDTVVRDVMVAYYELVFARENVVVQEKGLELADRQASENRKRVEVGTMAPLDEKEAEARAATARAALIEALQLLGTAERVLISLITDNYEEWQGKRLVPTESLVAVPQSYNLPASWVSALTHRPDLNRLKADLEREGFEVRLRYNQLFPQLDLVGSYGRAGVDRRFSPALEQIRDEHLPRYSVGIVLSVPLGNRGARGSYGAARVERDRAALRVKDLHQTILVEVENAIGVAQGEFQSVSATREAAAAAEAAYDAEVKKLENGKSTSFLVLEAQKRLTDARRDHIRALADYNNALAELYFREGTILEKRRIKIEP